MNTTLFLAQIYGPILLAVGLGIFVSRNYYRRIYKELERDTLAVFTFGFFAMFVGIIQVFAHNVWQTLPQVIISVIGWGMLLKGAGFIIVPGAVDKMGDYWADNKLIPIAGYATLILGAYLSWFAYFA